MTALFNVGCRRRGVAKTGLSVVFCRCNEQRGGMVLGILEYLPFDLASKTWLLAGKSHSVMFAERLSQHLWCVLACWRPAPFIGNDMRPTQRWRATSNVRLMGEQTVA